MIAGPEKVFQLLESFDDVMLITQGSGTYFDARPMRIAKKDHHCNVWFLTDNDSKVVELENNPNASIIAQDKSDCWLSISGKVEIKNDIELIKSLWKEPYWEWFPHGTDGPGMRALVFYAERAEYWDKRGVRTIEHIFKVVKAYIAGTAPEPEVKSHESVRL